MLLWLRRTFALILIGGFALVLGTPQPAAAASFNVNTTNDTVDINPGDGICADGSGDCSLRAAIMETNALAGADTIVVPPGQYNRTLGTVGEDAAASGDLDITDDLTITAGQWSAIESPAEANLRDPGTGVVISAWDGNSREDRVFDIAPGAQDITVSLHGLTITEGQTEVAIDDDDGGGVRITNGTVTITSSAFNANTAQEDGGAIHVDGGLLTVSDSLFTYNEAINDDGGALYTRNGTVTVEYSVFKWNTADSSGGALYNLSGSLVSNHNTFEYNTAGNIGGAIFDSAGLSIRYSNFLYNEGGIGGGAISTTSGGFIGRSTFAYNVTPNEGGAIQTLNSDDLRIQHSTFTHNTAANGGAVAKTGNAGAVDLHSTTILDNTASTAGGALYMPGRTINSISSIIMDNVENGAGDSPVCEGNLISQGYNMLPSSVGTDCNVTSQASDKFVGLSWMLPLSDNGGPTYTRMPRQPNIAMGNGAPSECASGMVPDQRGAPSVSCDIGAVETASNLIFNGDFDLDTDRNNLPDGWNHVGGTRADGFECIRTFSPECALRFVSDSSTKAIIQNIDLPDGATSGTDYAFSFYVSGEGVSGTPPMGVRVTFINTVNGNTDAHLILLGSTGYINAYGPDWGFLYYAETLTSGINHNRVKIEVGTQATSGSMIVDDLWLVPVP